VVRRSITLLGTLGLACGLAVLSAAPTTAQPATTGPDQAQTVSFTTTPPEDATWFDGATNWGIGYVASAEATSGLPVTYSVDPASADVCDIDELFSVTSAPSRAAIGYRGPGTCTIRADQVGNDTYLPAPQVVQSFVIGKVQPKMSGLKGRKVVAGLPAATFQATLLVPVNIDSHTTAPWGYPGQVVTFLVAGKPVCSGTTDNHGIATCTAPLGLLTWVTQLRFTASYAGNDLYKPVSASGPFLG
jgi:hypothetical protein